MNEIPSLKKQCPVLEAHVIPQSEGASTSDYQVLILPTQEGVVWLSQWGGQRAWDTLLVITVGVPKPSLTF